MGCAGGGVGVAGVVSKQQGSGLVRGAVGVAQGSAGVKSGAEVKQG